MSKRPGGREKTPTERREYARALSSRESSGTAPATNPIQGSDSTASGATLVDDELEALANARRARRTRRWKPNTVIAAAGVTVTAIVALVGGSLYVANIKERVAVLEENVKNRNERVKDELNRIEQSINRQLSDLKDMIRGGDGKREGTKSSVK